MRKKKFTVCVLTVAMLTGFTVQAASDIRVISTGEKNDIEYNGVMYEYVAEETYETTDPDAKAELEDRDGWNLKEITYTTPEPVTQIETETKEKTYKDLLTKDASKIKDSIVADDVTYTLSDVEWEETPNVEQVEYTLDFGYCTEKPSAPDTYEYTYVSTITDKENTVTLPLVRLEEGDTDWVDGFSAQVTFHNIEGKTFTLGDHTFQYNADQLTFSESDYKELIRMLGYDTSKYRLTSAKWSGDAYKTSSEVWNRKAIASGQQYAAKYEALYQDEVENGKIYTAKATYTADVEKQAEPAVYRITVTGYYEKDSVWINIVSFVTEHTAATGFLLLFIILAVAAGITATVRRKKKTSQNETYDQDIY